MLKLTIKRSVLKDLRSLPKETRGRAALSILELATLPSPQGVEKKRSLDGTGGIRGPGYITLGLSRIYDDTPALAASEA